MAETKTRGRPKGTIGAYKAPEEKKEECIYVRCTTAEKQKIYADAEITGLTVSKYILSKLL